ARGWSCCPTCSFPAWCTTSRSRPGRSRPKNCASFSTRRSPRGPTARYSAAAPYACWRRRARRAWPGRLLARSLELKDLVQDAALRHRGGDRAREPRQGRRDVDHARVGRVKARLDAEPREDERDRPVERVPREVIRRVSAEDPVGQWNQHEVAASAREIR